MIPYPLVFLAVLALTLLSASAAMTIALMVDTKWRPSAALVVRRLMEVTLIGTGAIVALLEFDSGRLDRSGYLRLIERASGLLCPGSSPIRIAILQFIKTKAVQLAGSPRSL